MNDPSSCNNALPSSCNKIDGPLYPNLLATNKSCGLPPVVPLLSVYQVSSSALFEKMLYLKFAEIVSETTPLSVGKSVTLNGESASESISDEATRLVNIPPDVGLSTKM